MKEGQIYINVTLNQQIPTPTSYMTRDLMGGGPSKDLLTPYAGVSVEGPSWREEKEKEDGWLIKRKGKQTLPIRGMRCLGCGYVELYVVEK